MKGEVSTKLRRSSTSSIRKRMLMTMSAGRLWKAVALAAEVDARLKWLISFLIFAASGYILAVSFGRGGISLVASSVSRASCSAVCLFIFECCDEERESKLWEKTFVGEQPPVDVWHLGSPSTHQEGHQLLGSHPPSAIALISTCCVQSLPPTTTNSTQHSALLQLCSIVLFPTPIKRHLQGLAVSDVP